VLVIVAGAGPAKKNMLVGPTFLFWEVNFVKLLEMSFFFPPHIILGVGKQHDLGNEKYQTVGDARNLRIEINMCGTAAQVLM
jgi:hypothetical protein